MRLLIAILSVMSSITASAFNDYYIDYLTASEKDKSLIVYENIHTGYTMKFLVKTKSLEDPEMIKALTRKVLTENAKHGAN